jgi:hypothetical protein
MADDSRSPGTSSLTGFKEIVTAIMALAIAAFTIYMLLSAFATAGRIVSADAAKPVEDAFAREKDILLYSLSLFGAVIGYYFGRVPAELHASRAEAQTAQTQAKLSQTEEQLRGAAQTAVQVVDDRKNQTRQFRDALMSLRSKLTHPVAEPREAMGAPLPPVEAEGLVAEIDDHLGRI